MMDYSIIGPIFAVASGCLCVTQSFLPQALDSVRKFGVQKLETSLYRVVQSIFRYLETVKAWLTSVTDGRTDRQTDFAITNATLH